MANTSKNETLFLGQEGHLVMNGMALGQDWALFVSSYDCTIAFLWPILQTTSVGLPCDDSDVLSARLIVELSELILRATDRQRDI